MARKTYTVHGPFAWEGHEPGETVTVDLPEDREKLLLDSGVLALGGEDGQGDAQVEKVACPACVEQELSKPPRFDDLEKLRAHYATKHQGLEPPNSLAA